MKPIVLYDRSRGYDNIKEGRKAVIYPVNHPSLSVSNGHLTFTSIVVQVSGKVFTTLNTTYVPIRKKVIQQLKDMEES